MFNEWLLNNHPEFSEGLLNNRFTRAAVLAGSLMGGMDASARAADPAPTPTPNKIDLAKAGDKAAIEYTVSVPASKDTAGDMSKKIVEVLQSLDGQIQKQISPAFLEKGGTYRMLYTLDTNRNQISAKNIAKFLPKPDAKGNVTMTLITHIEYGYKNPKLGNVTVVKPAEAFGK